MKNCDKILICPSDSIRKTIQIIDSSALQIALVVDINKRLLGTVTDGDIRRGILKGINLEEPVHLIMNCNPTITTLNEDRDHLLRIMKQKLFYQIPVVDEDRHVLGLEVLKELILDPKADNIVVLMAGGVGNRLRPLTNDCPKPLLRVGNKPILETILESFVVYGFRRFYLSVNYMAEMVVEYFGDGSKWGVEINYLREDKKLGTAGALGLLPEKPSSPILVMNGDLLTKVNFQQLLNFHTEHVSSATLCVREYDFQVPYGVVKLDGHNILSIVEKPIQRFFVNAGVYVIEPTILEMIPRNTYLDMPSLFDQLIKLERETAVFPIREYWLDIGRMDDFERAQLDFAKVFE
jgi:dTDP-glucose pyrophosphorylase